MYVGFKACKRKLTRGSLLSYERRVWDCCCTPATSKLADRRLSAAAYHGCTVKAASAHGTPTEVFAVFRAVDAVSIRTRERFKSSSLQPQPESPPLTTQQGWPRSRNRINAVRVETRSQAFTMGAKQEVSCAEDALVRRLHSAVGGPTALSSLGSPINARKAVLSVLARQQVNVAAAERVLRGDLTPVQRRAVRTVTNRGAAVRSRARQRRELARLQEELQRRDERARYLEAAIATLSSQAAQLCSRGSAFVHVPAEPVLRHIDQNGTMHEHEILLLQAQSPSHGAAFNATSEHAPSGCQSLPSLPESCSISSLSALSDDDFLLPSASPASISIDHDLFANLLDEMSSAMC